jgi:hypothetical protein
MRPLWLVKQRAKAQWMTRKLVWACPVLNTLSSQCITILLFQEERKFRSPHPGWRWSLWSKTQLLFLHCVQVYVDPRQHFSLHVRADGVLLGQHIRCFHSSFINFKTHKVSEDGRDCHLAHKKLFCLFHSIRGEKCRISPEHGSEGNYRNILNNKGNIHIA